MPAFLFHSTGAKEGWKLGWQLLCRDFDHPDMPPSALRLPCSDHSSLIVCCASTGAKEGWKLGWQTLAKGFNLQTSHSQPALVFPCRWCPCTATGAKEGWKLGWQTLVRELAPQDKSGAYVRQSYSFVTKESDIKVWGVEGGVHKV